MKTGFGNSTVPNPASSYFIAMLTALSGNSSPKQRW
jgi:hypothetical protein